MAAVFGDEHRDYSSMLLCLSLHKYFLTEASHQLNELATVIILIFQDEDIRALRSTVTCPGGTAAGLRLSSTKSLLFITTLPVTQLLPSPSCPRPDTHTRTHRLSKCSKRKALRTLRTRNRLWINYEMATGAGGGDWVPGGTSYPAIIEAFIRNPFRVSPFLTFTC